MGKPRFTAGPWVAAGANGETRFRMAAIPMRGAGWAVYANDAQMGHRLPAECPGPDAEANAALIAAAPDGYALAQAVKEAMEMGRPLRQKETNALHEQAVAYLSKANPEETK